jgi:hypothetical protein
MLWWQGLTMEFKNNRAQKLYVICSLNNGARFKMSGVGL